MRIAPQVVLTSEQRAKLEAYVRGRRTPARAGFATRPDHVAGRRRQARLELPDCFQSCRAMLLAGARVFSVTVSRGWSTTLRRWSSPKTHPRLYRRT
jgi:hypothetical protein